MVTSNAFCPQMGSPCRSFKLKVKNTCANAADEPVEGVDEVSGEVVALAEHPDERPVGALHDDVGRILPAERRDLVRLLGARRGAYAAQRKKEPRDHGLTDSRPLGGHCGVWSQTDFLLDKIKISYDPK